MYKNGIDVKEFGDGLTKKLLYKSKTTPNNDSLVIDLSSEEM